MLCADVAVVLSETDRPTGGVRERHTLSELFPTNYVFASKLELVVLHMCTWQPLSLFEQDSVVAEWEGFLEGIVSVPRPAETDRSLGLAVDASNFPRKVPWCRLVSCWRRRNK